MLNATHLPAPASPDTAVLTNSTPLDEAQKTATASSQGQQNMRNAQILEASLQVSLQTGNDSLALLYRTAVDAINQELAPELGPDAIQNAMGRTTARRPRQAASWACPPPCSTPMRPATPTRSWPRWPRILWR